MQTVQSHIERVYHTLRHPASLMNQAQSTANAAANAPQSYMQRLRNMDSATLVAAGVVTAECVGFFTVGEMIGRFKFIGYRGDVGHH